ncbi:hypothetical protein FIBSPDRAFT_931087 [Athelia psychrophila]|uniref:Uncharacterized protein n=1 Tax=Athelia psychrophila TaxID=1759441 RepID=A0A166L0R3_9AGAM|nr:hypothetical protein FIBSPDRAFT_931087 [Fibularhizoctonia sp. CBS 109695]
MTKPIEMEVASSGEVTGGRGDWRRGCNWQRGGDWRGEVDDAGEALKGCPKDQDDGLGVGGGEGSGVETTSIATLERSQGDEESSNPPSNFLRVDGFRSLGLGLCQPPPAAGLPNSAKLCRRTVHRTTGLLTGFLQPDFPIQTCPLGVDRKTVSRIVNLAMQTGEVVRKPARRYLPNREAPLYAIIIQPIFLLKVGQSLHGFHFTSVKKAPEYGKRHSSNYEERTVYFCIDYEVLTYLWDWLLNVTNEVLIVGHTTMNVPLVESPSSDASSASRLPISVSSALPIEYANLTFWWAASTANSLLVFFRIHAVYSTTVPYHFTSINYCGIWSPLSPITNSAVFLNPPSSGSFIFKRVYGITRPSPPGEPTSMSGALLRSRLLYYGLTFGCQIACTSHVFLGLPYAEFVGMIYVGLPPPCSRTAHFAFGTPQYGCRGNRGMMLASMQFVRSFGDEEDGYADDGGMGMRSCVRFALCGGRGEGAAVDAGASMSHAKACAIELFGLLLCFNSACTRPRYRSFSTRSSDSPGTCISSRCTQIINAYSLLTESHPFTLALPGNRELLLVRSGRFWDFLGNGCRLFWFRVSRILFLGRASLPGHLAQVTQALHHFQVREPALPDPRE